MDILVTGCTGFIGSRLINLLIEAGHYIYCISRKDACPAEGKVNHLQYDLSKSLNYKLLPTSLDCIIHLAATMEKTIKDSDIFLINISSALHLLEYGKEIGIKKFVFASSGAVYGYSKELLSEESPINPIGFYGLSKYQSELIVNYYSQWFSTSIMRLFFPYGPGQTKSIVPRLIRNIKNKEAVIIYNDGNPKIKPVYITDVIKAVDKLVSLKGKHTLNICGDEVINIKELCILIGRYLEVEPIFRYVTDEKATNIIADNAQMKKLLGIVPAITLEQGIQQCIAHKE